jgi:nitrate/nitrite transport system substrate-binding protein
MAKVLAEPRYLNAPEIVVEQVLSGTYADGLGNVKTDPLRVDYQPFPQYSAAIWLMTQLRRWNMLKEDIDYRSLAEKVMLATDAARVMSEQGAKPPSIGFGREQILGKEFDSAKPQDYLATVRKSG